MNPKSFLSVLFAFLTLCLLSYSSLGQAPPPKPAEAAMNNALQALKDSKWYQAAEAFDLVLMIAPDYAPAYIGKLCAELQVTEEKLLGTMDFDDYPSGIDDHPLYESALEHADAAYKKQIQRYAETINKRLIELEASINGDVPMAGDRMLLTIIGVEYAFRWCPAGTFMMGSPRDEPNRQDDEYLHQVTLSKGFWMLETEVTQLMWASIMGNDPSEYRGTKLPVAGVTWDACQMYIVRLNNLRIAPAGFRFALPTEAQWEYACRAGTKTAYSFGNTLTDTQANFHNRDNNFRTKEVGSYPGNAWGLYDMHGNVWEWCQDRYDSLYNAYPNRAVVDPIGGSSRGGRVYRGGNCHSDVSSCRSAFRFHSAPERCDFDHGLRVALVPNE